MLHSAIYLQITFALTENFEISLWHLEEGIVTKCWYRDIWIVVLEVASQGCGGICKTSCDMMECKLIYSCSEKGHPTKASHCARAAMSKCELWVVLVTLAWLKLACMLENTQATQARSKLKGFQRDWKKKPPTRLFTFPSSLLPETLWTSKNYCLTKRNTTHYAYFDAFVRPTVAETADLTRKRRPTLNIIYPFFGCRQTWSWPWSIALLKIF